MTQADIYKMHHTAITGKVFTIILCAPSIGAIQPQGSHSQSIHWGINIANVIGQIMHVKKYKAGAWSKSVT